MAQPMFYLACIWLCIGVFIQDFVWAYIKRLWMPDLLMLVQVLHSLSDNTSGSLYRTFRNQEQIQYGNKNYPQGYLEILTLKFFKFMMNQTTIDLTYYHEDHIEAVSESPLNINLTVCFAIS